MRKPKWETPTSLVVFYVVLVLQGTWTLPSLDSPTQISVSTEETTVVPLQLSSDVSENVNITEFDVQSEPTDEDLIADIKAHLSISGNNLTVSMGASPTIETEVRILFTLDDGFAEFFGVVKIIVTGPNEAPKFSASLFSFTIPEDTANDYTVGSVTFIDEESNTVSLTLETSVSGIFTIKPDSDEILVLDNTKIDREQQPIYTFTVTAEDTEGLTSNTTVVITLADVNDETPVFTNDESDKYHIIIKSTNPGTILINLTVSDDDIGQNAEYTLSLNDNALPFSVIANQFSVNGVLEVGIYEIVVIVIDNGTLPLSSNITVTVQVEPDNNYAPEFVNANETGYTFDFYENTNDSTFNFQVVDSDIGSFDTPGTANITLLPSTYSASFELLMEYTDTYTNSTLVSLDPFDQESLQTFNLTVQAVDTGYVEFRKTSEVTITINILDVNDNPPKFSASSYFTKVNENASIGHQFFRVSATDNDTNVDVNLFYLSNNTDTFDIDPNTGWLEVTQELDRGSFPSYVIEVVVTDELGQNDTSIVYVTVIEVNNNFPQFEPSVPSELTIVENSNFSLNISVTDDDLGEAGEFFLTLEQEPGSHFDIQDDELILVTGLDYESVPVIELNITVTDEGEPSLSNTTTIIINVDDINEFPPEFSSDSYDEEVLSISVPGNSLTTVIANDEDGRDNKITYTLTDYSLFDIDGDTGVVTHTKNFPSLESNESVEYTLTVVATDNGLPENKNTTATLTIIVFPPDNFYNPVLDQEVYNATINENSDIGTSILTIVATDDDSPGPASRIETFVLLGDDAHLFYIENLMNNTGILRSNASFNYEENQEFSLVVHAEDDGQLPRSSLNSDIIVKIGNLNDNTPEFEKDGYSFNVPEGNETPLDTDIGSVNAIDADGDSLTFSITPNAGDPVFEIVIGTGLIQFKGPDLLDYDTEPTMYTYTVEVSDGETSSTTQLDIIVTDINDKSPEFVKEFYSFELNENTPLSPIEYIGSVRATDDDSGTNAEITYDTNSTLFNVASNGSIYPAVEFDREAENGDEYTFYAFATDGGEPANTDTVVVIVTILDVNDNEPDGLDATISINESTIGGTFLGAVFFEDLDDANTNNSILTYGIIGGSGEDLFTIDKTNGSLYTASNATFDFEHTAVYELIVEATDGGDPVLSGTVTLTINILNVDDTDPYFTLILSTVTTSSKSISTQNDQHIFSSLIHLSSVTSTVDDTDPYFTLILSTVTTSSKSISTQTDQHIFSSLIHLPSVTSTVDDTDPYFTLILSTVTTSSKSISTQNDQHIISTLIHLSSVTSTVDDTDPYFTLILSTVTTSSKSISTQNDQHIFSSLIHLPSVTSTLGNSMSSSFYSSSSIIITPSSSTSSKQFSPSNSETPSSTPGTATGVIPLPTIPPNPPGIALFVNPPVDVFVLDGGIATLDCNADGFPTPTIQWKFNDVEILNGGRYSITEQGVLNILNVGLDDIGMYICNATNGIGYVNGNISLKVQVPPTFTISPSNITGAVGSSVSFQCVAYGYPLPTITWNWTDNIAGDIHISNTTVSDYTVSSTIAFIDNLILDDNPVIVKCEAVNDLVEEKVTMSTIGVLIDNYPAELTFFDGTGIVNETDLFRLRCDFKGRPLPNVRWFRYTQAISEEEELVNSSRINILNVVIKSEEPSTRVLSFLNISGIKREEAGIYKCVGDNGVFNYIEAVQYNDFHIIVQVPPYIIPSNGKATLAQTRNGTITISFNITAQPPVDPSDIQWYFVEDNVTILNNTKKYIFSADQHSLTLLNVQISDVGTYRIEAENMVGSSIAEVSLFVYVEAALQNTTGYTIERVSGQSISFNCTADGINRPIITWRKDGQLILTTARLNIDSVNDVQGFRSILGVQQINSSLTISDLRESDNGSYSCRADNKAEMPVSLDSPFLLNVSVPSIPNPCLSSPCQNGNCEPLVEDYLCICNEGYTGTNCDIVVRIFIPPTIEVHPEDTTGELYESASLICTASGNPAPNILWYKDNVLVPNTNNEPSILIFDELNPDDRGFYYCVAESIIHGIRESDVSMEIVLNINGVVQYEAVIDLPQDFFETERRKRQNQVQSQQIANLISQINDYLSGSILTSNVTFFVVDMLNLENINFSPRLQMIPIVITLVTNEGGSEELLEEVEEEMGRLGMQLNINITINEVDRFDGCRFSITDIPSNCGNPNLTISIEWPESNIGELAEIHCPCGNIISQEGSLIATRYCGGDFTNGGQWENPNAAPCNFSDLAREICQLAELETEGRLQQLDEFTENSDNLGLTEVIVSVAVLLTAAEEVSGNLSLTNDFFNVVDNIINVDTETLRESQESSNTSAMTLQVIASVAEQIPVGNTSEPVVITRSTFAVSVQLVDLDKFTEIGQTFSVNLGTFSDLNVTENINPNNLSFDMKPNQSTASLSLPNTFFSATPDVTNNTRIIHAVFLSDSLFLRRENNDLEVGSIVISASLVGSNSVKGIDPPLNITFLKNPGINGTDPQCSFWNPMLDDGYGNWSSEGCEIDENYNDSQDVVTCFCNHLTSFSILLDVSPEIEPTEDTPLALVLEAVTYIGLIISICCLVITIISYLSSIKLRTSEHGQLLINLCFALMGLYITFIVAVHSRTVTSLCALSAAVLQYFFLVTFMLMAAEAINLYMKLVIVLGTNIPHFVLKATIVSWLMPIFIVLFCFAPSYKNYVSDHFCRAFNIPYYIGMVVPFSIVYIFNWAMFFIIIVTLLCKFCKRNKKKQENISFIRQQLVIVTTLSVLFGLGWGIGLFATQDIHNNKIVRDVLAALFVIVTAFHGLFIFIMHCLRSRDIRSVWKQWFYGATGKNFSDFSSWTYSRIRKYRLNTSHTDSTSDGDALKQYSDKRTPKSPVDDSSVFTFDDSNLKQGGSDTLKYSTGKSLSSQEDAITLEIAGKEIEISNEEEARMVESISSFNQTTVTLDCASDKEKQEMEEEMTTMYQNLHANTSPDCDDPEIN